MTQSNYRDLTKSRPSKLKEGSEWDSYQYKIRQQNMRFDRWLELKGVNYAIN